MFVCVCARSRAWPKDKLLGEGWFRFRRRRGSAPMLPPRSSTSRTCAWLRRPAIPRARLARPVSNHHGGHASRGLVGAPQRTAAAGPTGGPSAAVGAHAPRVLCCVDLPTAATIGLHASLARLLDRQRWRRQGAAGPHPDTVKPSPSTNTVTRPWPQPTPTANQPTHLVARQPELAVNVAELAPAGPDKPHIRFVYVGDTFQVHEPRA